MALLPRVSPTVCTDMTIIVTLTYELLSENGACSLLKDCRLVYLTYTCVSTFLISAAVPVDTVVIPCVSRNTVTSKAA